MDTRLSLSPLTESLGTRLMLHMHLSQQQFFLFHTQLNGTNTTYLDVCPLLEPSPSTPSGDYVQPVNVARNIELNTRNLPAPVSFILVCTYLLYFIYFPLLPCRSVDSGMSAVWEELSIFQLSTTMRAHLPAGSTKTR